MGAVFVTKEIHDAFMNGPEHIIEFFHGYTYSGNPMASAAALGDAGHLQGRGPADARRRTRALLGGRGAFAEGRAERHRHPQYRPRSARSRLVPIPGEPASAASTPSSDAFEHGAMMRITGDIIALSPPLIITKGQIDELIDHVRDTIRAVA